MYTVKISLCDGSYTFFPITFVIFQLHLHCWGPERLSRDHSCVSIDDLIVSGNRFTHIRIHWYDSPSILLWVNFTLSLPKAIKGFCKQCRFWWDSSSRAVFPEIYSVCHLDIKIYQVSRWTKKKEVYNSQLGRLDFVKFDSERIIQRKSKTTKPRSLLLSQILSLHVLHMYHL